MEGLREIGQEIGKLFVSAIENQPQLQSERDDMNYLRYKNMIGEELKNHSEDMDRQMKYLENRFLEMNMKRAKEALGSEKRANREVLIKNVKVNIGQQGEAANNFVKFDSQDCKVSRENGLRDKGANLKFPMYCRQSFDKEEVGRLAIQGGSNSIKLTINGEQQWPTGDSESFIEVCSDTKNLQ